MATVVRRASMTLYSHATDHYSHRMRIVLAEKGINADVLQVTQDTVPRDFASLNPYHTLPVLVDRELSLYETKIMMEYLDERFPHPPLLPVYPVTRAQVRLLAYRIDKDWSVLVDDLLSGGLNAKAQQEARKALRDNLITTAPVFNEMPYFMSEEFTLLDCMLAPILWRLPVLDIELPEKSCKGLYRYMSNIFHRDGFLASLTDQERDMRRAR